MPRHHQGVVERCPAAQIPPLHNTDTSFFNQRSATGHRRSTAGTCSRRAPGRAGRSACRDAFQHVTAQGPGLARAGTQITPNLPNGKYTALAADLSVARGCPCGRCDPCGQAPERPGRTGSHPCPGLLVPEAGGSEFCPYHAGFLGPRAFQVRLVIVNGANEYVTHSRAI